MGALLNGSASSLHRKNCSADHDEDDNNNNKYQRNCSATKQEGSLFLPMEIVAQIFCLLDAQTALKLKSVCKQWRALIEDPNFVVEHASRAPRIRQYQDQVDIAGRKIQFLFTYDGLVLERIIGNASEEKYKQYRIRNPTMHRVFDLPDHLVHKRTRAMSISYAPSSGCYKLVSFYSEEDSFIAGVNMLTLGDQQAWRFVDPTRLRNFNERYGSLQIECFKGVLHFFPLRGLGSKDFEVVSLDMDKECFTTTMLPRSFVSGHQSKVLNVGYHDHRNLSYLSLAKVDKDELHLLVLEDYKKGKWAEEKIVIPLTFLKENSDMKSAQPYWASPEDVWFWVYRETKRCTIKYNIKSQNIIDKAPRPPRKKMSFMAKETLVIFKAMRSEEN